MFYHKFRSERLQKQAAEKTTASIFNFCKSHYSFFFFFFFFFETVLFSFEASFFRKNGQTKRNRPFCMAGSVDLEQNVGDSV